MNPTSLSYVTQRLEKDFYYAIHTLESGDSTRNVESGAELVLDVPKLDQVRLNYIKFNQALTALGYTSPDSQQDKDLIFHLWTLLANN